MMNFLNQNNLNLMTISNPNNNKSLNNNLKLKKENI